MWFTVLNAAVTKQLTRYTSSKQQNKIHLVSSIISMEDANLLIGEVWEVPQQLEIHASLGGRADGSTAEDPQQSR